MKTVQAPKLGKEIEIVPYRVKAGKVYARYFHEGVQAGFPNPADDFGDVPLSLDEKYLADPEATYLVRVVGKSMLPTLQVNDILVVKSNIELHNDAIAILSLNHTDFTVKRFDSQSQRLLSDNAEFKPIKLSDSDTLVCLGVVKHLVRDI